MVVPGERLPTGETLPSDTGGPNIASQTSSTTTSTTAKPVVSTNPATTTSQAPSSMHMLSGGAIAGIVVGGILAVAVLGILIFYLGRHRTELEFLRRDVHRQSQRPWSPEAKVGHTYRAAGSPIARYGPDGPRIGEQQSDNLPPYPAYQPATPLPGVAELGTAESIRPRPHSPWSDTNTLRDPVSPPLRGFMEYFEAGPEQHELPGRRETRH